MQTGWKTPLLVPSLPEDAVHLWRMDLSAPETPLLLANADAVLSVEEQARARRLLVPQARLEFLAARTLLRLVLSDHLGIPAADVRLLSTTEGKPYLGAPGTGSPAATEALCFNVSHSDGMVLIALARNASVGVDVESMAAGAMEADELLALAKDHFGPWEHKALAKLEAGPARVQAFLEIWTRREAVSKADGHGIGRPFTLHPANGHGGRHRERAYVLERDRGADRGLGSGSGVVSGAGSGGVTFYVRRLEVGPNYVGALALERAGYRLFCLRAEGLFG